MQYWRIDTLASISGFKSLVYDYWIILIVAT